ncbi:ankyrin, partial [Neocallimastix californiae]
MLSCKFDNEEIIRPLLENGARINRQDKNGDTALTYASRYGCTKAVYLLMRCNANGNIKNKRGETALIIACRHVNEGIIHILINQPIDIDLQDRNGNTALIYLCQKKNEYTELVREFLLKHNVNVNIKNKAGNSALHIAVFNNHLEIVKLLL